MQPTQSRPPVDPLTGAALLLAVVAVSSSGPLIAFAAAPALAIAFWRNTLAVGVLGPFSLVRRRAEFRSLTVGDGRREGWYCVLSGVALAAHFATWMSAVQLTSVAAATALGATQPVWQGLIARWQGRRLPGVVWVGIGVAVLGAALATGADLAVSGRAVAGDLLAVAGGMFAAVYTAFGERARVAISTTTYTTICYGVCGLILLVGCLATGVPLVGFDTGTWLAILGLVAGAQLLGHSMFNYALRRISATTVSVLILLEVPGAALLAWLWLGQAPRPLALPGLGMLVVGVVVVVLGGARAVRRGAPVPLPADPAPLAD
ncbi:Permease of the drug/metabolite transporter (DMT) superfamily [Micromonospora mirobrigensis]|uniref:Permease of the drug/metabolite transporter (DMT) superfamily n=1 Tax=Micromonospora mirobrigensis TaxID=262898 RepID=A0A1C4UZ26_9ACTN|nr:DMT family transporter [Micromonospora mirobrigensis]SCE77004.1 Permease of the drug/metabolite transporter (DMT) superfamily [Micromonospora mirobrigensis]